MLGRDTPAGLAENDQFREVAARHLDPAIARALDLRVNPDTTGRLKIVIDGTMDLGIPKASYDADGRGTYTAGTDSRGTAHAGDGYVAALGRENQVPQVVSDMMMQARREQGEGAVTYEPMYDGDGAYVGYTIAIERKGRGKPYVFEITGAVSRFVPRASASRKRPGAREPSRDPAGLDAAQSQRVDRAGQLDAPPPSGNFAGGFVATATQAWRYAMDRMARLGGGAGR